MINLLVFLNVFVVNPDSAMIYGIYNRGQTSTLYIYSENQYKIIYYSCIQGNNPIDSGLWQMNNDTLLLFIKDSIIKEKYLFQNDKLYDMWFSEKVVENTFNKLNDHYILGLEKKRYKKFYPDNTLAVTYSYSDSSFGINTYFPNGLVWEIRVFDKKGSPVETWYIFDEWGEIKEIRHYPRLEK